MEAHPAARSLDDFLEDIKKLEHLVRSTRAIRARVIQEETDEVPFLAWSIFRQASKVLLYLWASGAVLTLLGAFHIEVFTTPTAYRGKWAVMTMEDTYGGGRRLAASGAMSAL